MSAALAEAVAFPEPTDERAAPRERADLAAIRHAARAAGDAAEWLSASAADTAPAVQRLAAAGISAERLQARRPSLRGRLFDPCADLFVLFQRAPWLEPWLRRPEALQLGVLAVGAAYHGAMLKRLIDRRQIASITQWVGLPAFRWATARGAGGAVLMAPGETIADRVRSVGRWGARGVIIAEAVRAGVPDLGDTMDGAAQRQGVWSQNVTPTAERLSLARSCLRELQPWT